MLFDLSPEAAMEAERALVDRATAAAAADPRVKFLMVVTCSEGGFEIAREKVAVGRAHRWARFQSETMGMAYVIRRLRIEAVFRRGKMVHFLLDPRAQLEMQF